MYKRFVRVFTLLAPLLLAGCGDGNPLLGTWQSDTVPGLEMAFSSGEATASINGKQQKSSRVSYVIKGDEVIMTIEGTGVVQVHKIIDDNTMAIATAIGLQKFSRVHE